MCETSRGEAVNHLRQPARVGVYFDSSNLTMALKTNGGQAGQEQRKVRFDKILEAARKYGSVCIARAYFDIRTPEAVDVYRTSFCEALERMGIEPVPVYRGCFKESRVDMRLGAEMLEDVLLGRIDVVVLASGDSDFIEHVRIAKKHGAQVIVVPSRRSTSPSLRSAADLEIPYESLVPESEASSGGEQT